MRRCLSKDQYYREVFVATLVYESAGNPACLGRKLCEVSSSSPTCNLFPASCELRAPERLYQYCQLRVVRFNAIYNNHGRRKSVGKNKIR